MSMTQFRNEGESNRVTVVNLTRGTTLADRAEYARGPWRRLIGLLGRATLSNGEGLIFAPCTGLHTIGMRFPVQSRLPSTHGIGRMRRCGSTAPI